MTIKILSSNIEDSYISDICSLLIYYGNLIFSEYQNPVSIFFNELESGKAKLISLLDDDLLLGFVILNNFHKISNGEFYCYMYGASIRGVANLIEKALSEVFISLKEQGCVAVRCETYIYNMPMRFLANRLHFKKVGILAKTVKQNGKYSDSILYEKIL